MPPPKQYNYDVKSFVMEVKNHSLLYDISDVNHMNREMTQAAYKLIAENLNLQEPHNCKLT